MPDTNDRSTTNRQDFDEMAKKQVEAFDDTAKKRLEAFNSALGHNEPIEQEILRFVRRMKSDMERTARTSLWPGVRKEVAAYIDAYATVEKHIVREIRRRW